MVELCKPLILLEIFIKPCWEVLEHLNLHRVDQIGLWEIAFDTIEIP
jgi:hypothetical protein